MKLTQLSVFLENRPGRLRELCETLSGEGINITTLSLADTEKFGILRLIVKDVDRARAALGAKGFVVKTSSVLAVEVSDEPGGLARILAVAEKGGLSVEYMYAFTIKSGGRGILVFRFDDTDKAIAALQAAKVNVLSSVDLFARV
ncbi:MAG: ACT domain-containing protein [Lentisphaerae bacterium]|nr:ACT domain-containing protein [Lentisphaerota bacterium]